MEQPIKSWSYRGYALDLYRSGWYSALTYDGYIKTDTLDGLKKLIDERARNDYQSVYVMDDYQTAILIHNIDDSGAWLTYEVERLDRLIKPLREVKLYHDDKRNDYYFFIHIRGKRYRIRLSDCRANLAYSGRYDY